MAPRSPWKSHVFSGHAASVARINIGRKRASERRLFSLRRRRPAISTSVAAAAAASQEDDVGDDDDDDIHSRKSEAEVRSVWGGGRRARNRGIGVLTASSERRSLDINNAWRQRWRLSASSSPLKARRGEIRGGGLLRGALPWHNAVSVARRDVGEKCRRKTHSARSLQWIQAPRGVSEAAVAAVFVVR